MKIESFKEENEQILWKGKPNKSVFIKERIFSPLFIVAAIWLAFDIAVMSIFFGMSQMPVQFRYILPVFFIIHLFPVWAYLGRIIFSFSSWKNTEYMVTDKAVYCLTGVFTTVCERKTFQEITNVSLHQGVIDKSHNVGDVFIATGVQTLSNGRAKTLGINIIDIEDYMKVYKLISKTGRDIFSDTMYPNELRPKTNNGYNTEYKPENDFKIDEEDFKIDKDQF